MIVEAGLFDIKQVEAGERDRPEAVVRLDGDGVLDGGVLQAASR